VAWIDKRKRKRSDLDDLADVRESAGLLDEQVDGFGAAVGDPAGLEVGQHLRPPRAQFPAEAGDLGDGAGGERCDDLLGDLTSLSGGAGVPL
jgi:hypothetical protein